MHRCAVGWSALEIARLFWCVVGMPPAGATIFEGTRGEDIYKGRPEGHRSPTRTCLALPYLQFTASSI